MKSLFLTTQMPRVSLLPSITFTLLYTDRTIRNTQVRSCSKKWGPSVHDRRTYAYRRTYILCYWNGRVPVVWYGNLLMCIPISTPQSKLTKRRRLTTLMRWAHKKTVDSMQTTFAYSTDFNHQYDRKAHLLFSRSWWVMRAPKTKFPCGSIAN